MSIIMPVGENKVKWSPDSDEVVKVASVGDQPKSEKNDLYEAAKKHFEAKAAKEAQDMKEEVKEPTQEAKEACGAVPKEEEVVLEVAKEDDKDVKEDDKVATEDDKEEPKGEAKEIVKEVIEKIEDATQELKEVVEEVGEIEIEVPVEDVSFEVDSKEIPGEKQVGPDIIVESEPACGCMSKSDKAKVKTSSSEEDFCKFAKLSPINKKKLVDYWVNQLNYPRDYVELMT